MNKPCEKLKPFTSLFLRLALGVVFIYHGYGKIFAEGAGMGTSWNPDMSTAVQALVAWGELLAGAGVLFGFMTCFASMAIIVIMAGAIILVHGANGFGMMGGGFEYNYVLILTALALIANGPGPYSFGCGCPSKGGGGEAPAAPSGE